MKHDVTSEDAWQDAIAGVEKQYGGLNILVNNAGIVIVATPESTTLEEFRLANAVMNPALLMERR